MSKFRLVDIVSSFSLEKYNIICSEKYIWIINRESDKIAKIFMKISEDEFVEVNMEEIASKIAEHLAPYINVKEYLKEFVLSVVPAPEAMEVLERLEKGGKVTPTKGCFSLMIGGKRGRPFEFVLAPNKYEYEEE